MTLLISSWLLGGWLAAQVNLNLLEKSEESIDAQFIYNYNFVAQNLSAFKPLRIFIALTLKPFFNIYRMNKSISSSRHEQRE